MKFSEEATVRHADCLAFASTKENKDGFNRRRLHEENESAQRPLGTGRSCLEFGERRKKPFGQPSWSTPAMVPGGEGVGGVRVRPFGGVLFPHLAVRRNCQGVALANASRYGRTCLERLLPLECAGAGLIGLESAANQGGALFTTGPQWMQS